MSAWLTRNATAIALYVLLFAFAVLAFTGTTRLREGRCGPAHSLGFHSPGFSCAR